MSCPSGTDMKAYIAFLRAYSERHRNLTAVDTLRKGIKEWQRLENKRKKRNAPKEMASVLTTSTASRSWCWIFGKRNKK